MNIRQQDPSAPLSDRPAERGVDRLLGRIVDQAPPLTEEQRARLAALLVNGGSADAVA